MSNLKYQTLAQLKESLAHTNEVIDELSQRIRGKEERRKWIEMYIYRKNNPIKEENQK